MTVWWISTRRLTAVVVCAVALVARSAPPESFDLGGSWSLKESAGAAAGSLSNSSPTLRETGPVSATVPGTVHTDLLLAGIIPDPFFGDNARRVAWIAETPWTYSRTFTPTTGLLARQKIVLECEGLDTVAAVSLNGRPVGRADNMFRKWTFDVKGAIRPGENTLTVTFTPLQQAIQDFVATAKGLGPNTAYGGMSNLRKATYSNGWDFAPKLPAVGIYKPIRLVGYDTVRLRGVVIDSCVDDSNAGRVIARPCLSDAAPAGTRVRASVMLNGRVVAMDAADAGGAVNLTVDQPQLWWPNGMGERPTYDVRVELLDPTGSTIDTAVRRTGFRDIKLVRRTDGRPLHLVVNGRPIFARGANWVPPDMFLSRVTPQRQRQLLQSAADVGMNTIRTWGGGVYEDDAFYDTCDELGLLVWHDFKFACNAYPGRNAAFADNVRQEVTQQVTRLSPHPSIAVWCGNNEVEAIVKRFGLMSAADYRFLFADLIGGGLHAILPNAAYVTGSPDEGDEHNWWVWHIGAEFERYRHSHGWMTEFGFQSFPSPATVDSFTEPADRASVLSSVMMAHQHNGNGRGNEMILDQIARYFRPAKDFESTLWLSQINQAYGLTLGIEHWRADWPRSSGALVWQLNDAAPAASWSMIDYFGRWKAAQYAMRRAFAPVLVTGVYDTKTDVLPLTICSDRPRAFKADVTWRATDLNGTTVASGSDEIDVPAGTTAVSGPALRLKDAVAQAGRDHLIVWVDLLSDGKQVASNAFFASTFKHLNLVDPGFSTTTTRVGDDFEVELLSRHPALFAWLDLAGDPDARFSDNFAHTTAGRPMYVRVSPSKPIDLDAFKKRLIARSLFDTAVATDATTEPTEGRPK